MTSEFTSKAPSGNAGEYTPHRPLFRNDPRGDRNRRLACIGEDGTVYYYRDTMAAASDVAKQTGAPIMRVRSAIYAANRHKRKYKGYLWAYADAPIFVGKGNRTDG